MITSITLSITFAICLNKWEEWELICDKQYVLHYSFHIIIWSHHQFKKTVKQTNIHYSILFYLRPSKMRSTLSCYLFFTGPLLVKGCGYILQYYCPKIISCSLTMVYTITVRMVMQWDTSIFSKGFCLMQHWKLSSFFRKLKSFWSFSFCCKNYRFCVSLIGSSAGDIVWIGCTQQQEATCPIQSF